jgi:hypothetical protein
MRVRSGRTTTLGASPPADHHDRRGGLSSYVEYPSFAGEHGDVPARAMGDPVRTGHRDTPAFGPSWLERPVRLGSKSSNAGPLEGTQPRNRLVPVEPDAG